MKMTRFGKVSIQVAAVMAASLLVAPALAQGKKKPAGSAEAEKKSKDSSKASASKKAGTGKGEKETAGKKAAEKDGAGVTKVETEGKGEEGVKKYTFKTIEVEGRLKSPQLLYFLRRVRAEFEAGQLGHRSFFRELSDTRRHPALR